MTYKSTSYFLSILIYLERMYLKPTIKVKSQESHAFRKQFYGRDSILDPVAECAYESRMLQKKFWTPHTTCARIIVLKHFFLVPRYIFADSIIAPSRSISFSFHPALCLLYCCCNKQRGNGSRKNVPFY